MTIPDSPAAQVVSVHANAQHEFSKRPVESILLLAGLGVEGDCHAGTTVQHLSRIRRDPTQPNLRQVHLIQSELFDRLEAAGHPVRPGELGENVATRGLDLLAMPTGTVLRLGASAIVQVTGLRNPCRQIEAFQDGLLAEVLHDRDGVVSREAGVMGVVLQGGPVAPGDRLEVTFPAGERLPLVPV